MYCDKSRLGSIAAAVWARQSNRRLATSQLSFLSLRQVLEFFNDNLDVFLQRVLCVTKNIQIQVDRFATGSRYSRCEDVSGNRSWSIGYRATNCFEGYTARFPTERVR